MRAFLTGLLVTGLCLVVGGAPLSAAGPEGHEKFRERLEIVTMWKLMDALNLDKPTADKIFEIRRKFLAGREAVEKELKKDFEALREKLRDEKEKTSDAELSRLVKSIREKRKKLVSLRDSQYEEVSKVLSPRQQAQLVIFLKDFQRELRALLRRPPGQGATPFHREMGLRPPPEGPRAPRPGPPGPGGPPHPGALRPDLPGAPGSSDEP